jgi:hypothetical protein
MLLVSTPSGDIPPLLDTLAPSCVAEARRIPVPTKTPSAGFLLRLGGAVNGSPTRYSTGPLFAWLMPGSRRSSASTGVSSSRPSGEAVTTASAGVDLDPTLGLAAEAQPPMAALQSTWASLVRSGRPAHCRGFTQWPGTAGRSARRESSETKHKCSTCCTHSYVPRLSVFQPGTGNPLKPWRLGLM